ncbi:unnamed protein product [Adineta steineri]|uniref:Uncharacterized protein n=1 Tax=Adineta steineri TaxID=433720 RepID=A0A813RVS5_9BILA|nr:unnamed protein product [Adineta steineri]CAF0787745.1 unnamed protein product [Adineta steineri]CAF3729621.1 unnamed protein product [Adineta steineri]CAF3729687.1 unnamed protein product [Adineta steineri]
MISLSMHICIIVFLILNNVVNSNTGDLYPSYSLSRDPMKIHEWSDNPVLAYVTTVRLFDYDHHIFQYRRYPCQYFYTAEIQIHHNNETINQCLHNTTTDDYEYNFQLHFDSRHVEPYILRNIAFQCDYINCSLSLLNTTFIYIGWNLKGRENNPNCSFDTNQAYNILRTPYTISESIILRCKSFSTCNQSKSNLEQSLSSQIQLIYGSSYELETPYCSLEKNLGFIIDKNFAQTNILIQQLLELMQQRFDKSIEYVKHVSTTTANTTVAGN